MKKILATTFSAFLLFVGCKTTGPAESNSPGCPAPVKGGDCEKYGFIITICSNHGHRIKQSLMKEKAFDYTMKGTADHQHLLIINGGHYFKLIKGQGIQVISEVTDGHTHTVTINCKKE